MSRLSVLTAAAVCTVLAAGCAKAQAKSSPDGPALQVPQPPPRVIVAAAEPPPLPVEEPPVAPVPQPAPPVLVPRPAPPPRATRPEPPVESPPANRVERTLRAPGDVARERAIRDRLTGASADLTRADYGRLSAGAREQYDQAKRFIQQAEQAIKDQNLAFASTLADKAATLAADLAGR